MKQGLIPGTHGVIYGTTDLEQAKGYSTSWDNKSGTVFEIRVPNTHKHLILKSPMHHIDKVVAFKEAVPSEWLHVHSKVRK